MARISRTLGAVAMSAVLMSPAAAAPAAASAINPLVALSAFGSAQSRAGLCAGAASSASAAAAAAAQAAQPGCVLPALDAPVAPLATDVPPPPMVAAPAPTAAFSVWPLLLALSGVAAAVLLFDDVKNGHIFIESPQ